VRCVGWGGWWEGDVIFGIRGVLDFWDFDSESAPPG